jgi:hypothetical protein
MTKLAYPNEDYGQQISSPHSIQKWMKSLQDMYAMIHRGLDASQAFKETTKNWDVMEQIDFKKWMSFYEEKAQEKYKTAQLKGYIDNGAGSFIPNIDQLKAQNPFRNPTNPYTQSAPPASPEVDPETQKLLNIKQKVRAIVSRLNSAERLVTDPDVQLTLKKTLMIDIEKWLESLQRLKREIQLAPIRSTSSHLIEDLIHKTANTLYYTSGLGYGQALFLNSLIKDAQAIPHPIDSPMPGQPPAPAGQSVDVGMVPTDDGGEDAIRQFLKNLNGDEAAVDDEETDEMAEITVNAQVAPPPPPPGPSTPPMELGPDTPPADLEVSEPSAPDESDAIDLALSNVKISDVVSRLEGIASLLKTRQIARELFIIDLMLDRLGIVPFFPTLGEAIRSILESMQYSQTRIEDILAKLRGAVITPASQEIENNSEEAIKGRLQQEEEADRARKEHRKQQQIAEENAAMNPEPAPEAPAVELAGPAEVQTAPQRAVV